MRRTGWGSILWLGAAVGAILLATLSEAPSGAGGGARCVLCADRAAADVVRNFVLFLPLGYALARWGRSWRVALVLVFALTAAIEFVQIQLPGRDANGADILFNTLGGLAGFGLARLAHRVAGRIRRASLVWSTAATAGLAVAAWMFVPDLPDRRYYVFWMPDLAQFAPAPGRLLDARIGDRPLSPGWRDDRDGFTGPFLSGSPLTLEIEPGQTAVRLAAYFAVYDDQQEEIVAVARQLDDLVVRLGRRADRWRFDRPRSTVPDWFTGLSADRSVPLSLSLQRGVVTAGGAGRPTRNAGFTLARSWSLLLYPDGLPRWGAHLLDLLFLVVLAGGAGLLGGWSWQAAASIVLLVGALQGLPLLLGGTLPLAGPPFAVLLVCGVGGAWLGERIGQFGHASIDAGEHGLEV